MAFSGIEPHINMNNQLRVSTSVKHGNFIREPIGKKLVKALPGVGDAAAKSFNGIGMTDASQVLGQFLLLRRDGAQMDKWLKEHVSKGCVMNSKHRADLVRCLSEWCQLNL